MDTQTIEKPVVRAARGVCIAALRQEFVDNPETEFTLSFLQGLFPGTNPQVVYQNVRRLVDAGEVVRVSKSSYRAASGVKQDEPPAAPATSDASAAVDLAALLALERQLEAHQQTLDTLVGIVARMRRACRA